MGKIADVKVGDKFELWTVLKVKRELHKHTMCLCKCVCGTEKYVDIGKSKNCGCIRNFNTANRNKRHGLVGKNSKCKCLAEWAEDYRCKVKMARLKDRYYKGWNHEEAISLPKQNRWSRAS
jgi:hypothetical protein